MAAIAQQPNNNQFTTIAGAIADNALFSGTRGSVSKTKSKQTSLSSSNAEVQLPKLHLVAVASPALADATTLSLQNPNPTSQNHPPKIKVLNRSLAVSSLPNDNVSLEETLVSVSSDKQPSPGAASNSSSSSVDPLSAPVNHCNVNSQHNARSTPTKQHSHDYASSSSTSSSLHRENSLDYKDSSGIDLHEFMVKTLRENPRDRLMLLKLERDFTDFIQDASRVYQRYPPMTSYHRMLVHRVAAYFGLDHNIDSSGKSVIVNKTPSTRIPDVRFQSYCSREYSDEEILSDVPKSILLRSNTASSEEAMPSPRHESPMHERGNYLEDKRAKSFEEREEDYIKAKDRIFNKDASLDLSELSSTTSASPLSTPDGFGRQRTHPHSPAVPGPDIQSEKEAAIAAVAAATGRKPSNYSGISSVSKRPDKFVKSALTTHHQYPFGGYTWPGGADPYVAGHGCAPGESYISSPYHASSPGLQPVGPSIQSLHPVDGVVGSPQVPTLLLNNASAAQPMLGADGSHVFFQHHGYQGHAPFSQITPSVYPQQQPHNPYGPVYFMSPAPGPPSQQYYVMQAIPPGHAALYQPGQAGGEAQSPSSSFPLLSSRPVTVQDLGGQFANLTLQQRRVSVDEDASSRDKVASGAAPSGTDVVLPTQVVYHQGRQCFLIPQGRVVGSPGAVYAQAQSGVPVQLMPGQPYGVSQYPQYVSAESGPTLTSHAGVAPLPMHSPQIPPSATHHPALQTSVSPVVSHYVARSPSSHGVVAKPESGPPSGGEHNSRFVQGILPMSHSVPVYMPVEASNNMQNHQYAATTSGAVLGYPTHSVYRSGDKLTVTSPESSGTAYQYKGVLTQDSSAQRPRSLVAVPPQHRPLLQVVPLNANYTYLPPRFISGHVYGQPQYVPRGMQSSYRRLRPRHPSQQIRISRRNSSGSDSELKTVSHILEVYDFPDTVTSNDDAVFDEIKNNGARILKINSSTSQQGVGANSPGGTSSSLGPTILAIFKSAEDAQRALETISSPYYKLRVSQKSQTHFSGDNHPSLGKAG